MGYEAKQSLPQRKMGLDAQEQLAKGYKARDVQNGGRSKVVKLESIELQEPPEKRMYRKSEPPYQIGDEAYPLPFVGTWGSLRLLPTFVGGQPGSNRNHEGRGKISLCLERH